MKAKKFNRLPNGSNLLVSSKEALRLAFVFVLIGGLLEIRNLKLNNMKKRKLDSLTTGEKIAIANIGNAFTHKNILEALKHGTKYSIDIHRAIKLTQYLQEINIL